MVVLYLYLHFPFVHSQIFVVMWDLEVHGVICSVGVKYSINN